MVNIIRQDHTRNRALDIGVSILQAERNAAVLSALAFEVRSGTVGELDNGCTGDHYNRLAEEKLCDRARLRPDAPIFFAFR